MRRKYSKLTKLVALFVAVIAALCAVPFGSMFLRAADEEEFAFVAPTQAESPFTSHDITVSNANFNESSVTEYSSSVSNWTSAKSSTMAVAGVIHIGAFDTFKTNNKLSDTVPGSNALRNEFLANNPLTSNSHDNNILIMTNKTPTGEAQVGYHSNEFSEFYADGYFIVSVDFYAVKSYSSVYLIPKKELKDGWIPSINITQASNSGMTGSDMESNESIWQTATFFVHTDLLESNTFKLGLYLGTQQQTSTGVVYYDNAKVTAVPESIYHTELNKAKAGVLPMLEVDLTSNEFTDKNEKGAALPHDNFNLTANGYSSTFKQSFGPSSGAQIETVRVGDIDYKLNLEKEVFGNATAGNSGVMLLSAQDAKASVKLKSPLTISRHQIYMINFYSISNGSTFMRVRDVHCDDENLEEWDTPYNSGFQNIQTSTTSSASSRNNWILNTFFIAGETLYDIDVDIEFWVGEDIAASGYLLIDDFHVSRVSHDFYEKFKSITNASSVSIDATEATATITNSNFNRGTIKSMEEPYPLKADSWTLVSEHEDKALSGVINTQTAHWKKYGNDYGIATNPGAIGLQDENNNIYMMQNREETWQKLTSNSFALSVGSTDYISFDAATMFTVGDSISFQAVIEVTGKEIARIDLSNNSRFKDWSTYTFEIKNSGFTAHEATLSFLLGKENEPTNGIAFIDNVRMRQVGLGGRAVVNMADASKFFDANGNSLFFVPADDEKAMAVRGHDKQGNDLLGIHTTGLYHTSVSNQLPEQIESGKWYEYTVKITIGAITPEFVRTYDENGELEEIDEEEIKYGVSFRLDGLDGGFENLKAEDIRKMPDYIDGFAELRFLINPDATFNLSLVVEFGNEQALVMGGVAIASIELKEIDESVYNLAKNSAEGTENTNIRMMSAATVGAEEDNTPTEEGDGTSNNWIIIPSIITGLAIIVALAGALIRKNNFSLHISKKRTSYARDDARVPTGKAPKSIKATKSSDEISDK